MALAALVYALAACGGGGDDSAGSLTAFSIVPASITVTGNSSSCPGAGFIGDVFVYGGAAPYRLDNTVSDMVALSTGEVSSRGGSFQVFSLGAGCLDPGQIVVVDKLDRQVTLTIVLKKGS